jgi:predicted glycosyltransferase involved in capsule biosynthesis
MGAKEIDEKYGKGALRKEYTRLRAIANKRIKRLAQSEWKDSQIFLENQAGFARLSQIHNDRTLRHELSQLARFVSSERSQISGQNRIRRKTVATLRDRGYDFVNVKNFREFADFMEFARTANLGKLYDSEKVADLYEELDKKDVPKEELGKAYKEWRASQTKQAKVQNKGKRDSKQFRKALE